MDAVSLLIPPLCVSCRAPAPGHPLCPACRRRLELLDRSPVSAGGLRVWAPLAYEGPARAVVRRLKFQSAVALAGHMAAVIAANAPAGFLGPPLVPVPTPRWRRRLRGFCHATLLAEALAERTGVPVVRALERRDAGRHQVGRARSERLRDPPRFRATRAGSGTVMLVDDVVTTGATLAACSRTLRTAGWRCGRAVAYARTPVR